MTATAEHREEAAGRAGRGPGQMTPPAAEGHLTGIPGPGQMTPRVGEGQVASRRPGKVYVARAELVLAREITAPLRAVPLRPDPLSPFADVAGLLKDEAGDRIDVVLDLIPLNAAKARNIARRSVRRRAEKAGRPWRAELIDAVRNPDPLVSQRRSRQGGRAPAVERTKFDALEPCFAVQLLLRAESRVAGHPKAILSKLLAAADQWSAENYFKVRSRNLLVARLGADSLLYRRDFDRRFATGQFSPDRMDQIVTAREISGLLKPPTKHCTSPHVARSGGTVPAPPKDLPVYRVGDRDCIPLGYALGRDGRERLLGMNLDELLFSFRTGKSGFGKTEMALSEIIALARGGGGLWSLDPHGDGWRRAMPYLADQGERIWEIDLEVRDHSRAIASWNMLSMEGLGREAIEDRVDMVVSSFAAALSWGDSAPRAKTLLTKACESLCELAVVLPPQYAPTIFQIPRLLEDELWRSSILAYLPPGLQNYWETSFARVPAEATSPVTNLINRMRTSKVMSAFFGASRSTYDVRRAMDTGAIVMVIPPPPGETSKLVSCMLVFDLFRAGRSRGDIPPDQRRRFDAFVDELTQIDGAARGSIAAILEQLRKFNVRLHAMTQMADRLTEDTKRALLQNSSMLATSAGGIDEVKVVTRQWGGAVTAETATKLQRFHHIVSVQNRGQTSTPFKVRGADVTDLFAEVACPELLEGLPAQLDANLARRPIRDTLADLDRLEDQIVSWLSANAQPRMKAAAPIESVADDQPPTPRRVPAKADPVAPPRAKKPRTPAPAKVDEVPPGWDSDTVIATSTEQPSNVVPLRRGKDG